MMSWETQYLKGFSDPVFLWFIFFSTLLSYCFHSIINTVYTVISPRHEWNLKNRKWLYFILVVSGIATSWIFLQNYLDNVLPFLAGGLLTFAYSAPNLPGKFFELLRKIAFGKTLFLAFMWAYATTMLPVLAYDPEANPISAFLGSRFYLVYAICILFDLRDREEDREKGIRALPTMLGNDAVKAFYFTSLAIAAFFSFMETWPSLTVTTFILLVPVIIGLFAFRLTKYRDSEMMYYVYLDGLMMMSAILHAIYLFSITFVFV
jgi:4-hydroxybenzoate polyprenyltransferase